MHAYDPLGEVTLGEVRRQRATNQAGLLSEAFVSRNSFIIIKKIEKPSTGPAGQ